jgi:hypothetical protein
MRIRFTKIPEDTPTTKLGRATEGEMNIRLIPYEAKSQTMRRRSAEP